MSTTQEGGVLGPAGSGLVSLFQVRPPLTDANALSEAGKTLMLLVNETTQRHQMTSKAAGAGQNIEKMLGGKPPPRAASGSLPWGGHSGELAQLPLLQFAPSGLRVTLKALGVRSLMDYLAAVLHPAGRRLVARALGMPVTSVLLSAMRAELLDLVVAKERAGCPHLKDVLLLGKLGVTSVHDLGALGGLLAQSPTALSTLADLIAAVQKRAPDWVGRQHITRHHLHEWAQGASRRGSDLCIPDKSHSEDPAPARLDEQAQIVAESTLFWFLKQRSAEPQEILELMMFRLLAWLDELSGADDKLRSAAVQFFASGHRVLWARLLEAKKRAREVDEKNDSLKRFRDFVRADSERSLFFELHPWARPDTAPPEGLICFYFEPVPDCRQALATTRAGAGQSPQSLQQLHVCMDPISGALTTPRGST